MRNSVERWLKEYGEEFLRRVGIKRGQTVLEISGVAQAIILFRQL